MNDLDLFVKYLSDDEVVEYDRLFKVPQLNPEKDIIINLGCNFSLDGTTYQLYIKGFTISEDLSGIENNYVYIMPLDNDIKEITPYVEEMANKVIKDVLSDIFKSVLANESSQS